MIIRKMLPEDVKRVVEIEEQCFSMPWSEKSFLDSIVREDTIFLVAESLLQKRILGYIGMYIAFEEGQVTNVAVSPEYRKQGVGNELVTAIQAIGREHDLERIILEVRVSNTNAISLYKRNGFTELGIRKNFYEKPTEDAYIMACEI